MQKQPKTSRINMRIDTDVMRWIRKAARQKRVTVSVFVRSMIHESFELRHKA